MAAMFCQISRHCYSEKASKNRGSPEEVQMLSPHLLSMSKIPNPVSVMIVLRHPSSIKQKLSPFPLQIIWGSATAFLPYSNFTD
jgi:hypothetical protein